MSKQTTAVIALDGHAGAGKSTVADLVAEYLGFWHINTGLYYRAVTWLALQEDIPISDQQQVEELARTAVIEVKENKQKKPPQEVYVNNNNITDAVRTPEINRSISQVAAYAGVREAITQRLQSLKHPCGIIMDGRDIGSVVFPNAALKIFLTASVEERARRQYIDAQASGYHISLQDFKHLVSERDRKDTERLVAPLIEAEDAIRIDSTGLTPKEIVQKIIDLWQDRQAA